MPKKLDIIWSHRPYSPYVMSLAAQATVFGFRKIFSGSSIDRGFNYYKEGQNTYLYLAKQYRDTAEAIAKKATENPAAFIKLLQAAYRRSLVLNKYSSTLPKSLKGISNERLVLFINHFSKLFQDMYAYGTAAILVGYSQDNLLYRTAEKILKTRTKGRPGIYSKAYQSLTAQPKLNRNVGFEKEILGLAIKAEAAGIKNRQELKKNFGPQVDAVQAKWSWLSYDLCEKTTWTNNYSLNLAAEKIVRQPQKQLAEIISYHRRYLREFNQAAHVLGLGQKERAVFSTIGNLAYYKWAREYEFVEALFRLKPLQDELARRLRIGRLAIKYLLPSEYQDVVIRPEYYRRELPKRIKESLIISGGQQGSVAVSGRQAADLWKLIEPNENSSDSGGIVRGYVAYGGRAIGRARIINSVRHLNKMKPGDILVSVTTSPSLLPAMKKASAIITNEGGITSHAAIVSREMKIPCIVGAKDATKMFQDGQKLEVDAKHGWAKVIA